MRSRSISPGHVLRAGVAVAALTALAGATLVPAASAEPSPTAARPAAPQAAPAQHPGAQQAPLTVAAQEKRERTPKGKQRGSSGVGKPITPEEAFARGEDWLQRKIPYSMTGYTHDRYGKSYRTDCSGFVSMAWHLPNSETTVSLPENTVKRISWDSLAPGDAVNRGLSGGNGHVMLVTKVEGSRVYVMEQTPPKVTRSVHDKTTLAATDYKPVRYKKMEAVSENDVREQIEKRMETLEERINKNLQREFESRAGDEEGSASDLDAENSSTTGLGGSDGDVAGRPAIASADGSSALAAPAADSGNTGDERRGKGKDRSSDDDALPDLKPRIQPPGYRTPVNYETIFSIRDESYREVIQMPGTGLEVEVYAEQTGWLWHWDDGSGPKPTKHSGNPYPDSGNPNPAAPRVTHTYTEAGTYQPRVDVEWGGYRYRIVGEDEEWTAIEGETTTSVDFPELEAVDIRAVLSDPF